MLDPMKCLDLIQTIETIRLYVKQFEKEAASALGSIRVNLAGTEVEGFWSKENLAMMELNAGLIAAYQPFLNKKLKDMIKDIEQIEQEVKEECHAGSGISQSS